MLIFETGLWVGKGSVLIEGNSLGQYIGFDLTIKEEADGLNLAGTCDGFLNAPLSARIAKNEFGVYVIDVARMVLFSSALCWYLCDALLGSLRLRRYRCRATASAASKTN